MSNKPKNDLLKSLLDDTICLQTTIQTDGKLAFDRIDPAAARDQASKLEQITRVEQLITELDGILSDLSIGGMPPTIAAVVSDATVSNRKPNTAQKGAHHLADGPALHPPQLANPVMDIIRSLGGTAHLHDIWAALEEQLGSNFTAADLAVMKNYSGPRWKYNVHWTLTNLKNAGHVEHAGKRGLWRLTSPTSAQ